jgi:hypothetical protein
MVNRMVDTGAQMGLWKTGSDIRNKMLADGVPTGMLDKVAQDNRTRSDRNYVSDAFVKGLSGGSTQKAAKKATTVTRKTPTTATKGTATKGAVNKRSTILTSSRGTEAPANIKRKTLLGA